METCKYCVSSFVNSFSKFCAWNKISWNIARMESWNWIYFKLPQYLFWRYTISRRSLYWVSITQSLPPTQPRVTRCQAHCYSVTLIYCSVHRLGSLIVRPSFTWSQHSRASHLEGGVVCHGAAGVERHIRHGASLRHDEHLHDYCVIIFVKLFSSYTFMDCETWRPVRTAVFISSQL